MNQLPPITPAALIMAIELDLDRTLSESVALEGKRDQLYRFAPIDRPSLQGSHICCFHSRTLRIVCILAKQSGRREFYGKGSEE